MYRLISCLILLGLTSAWDWDVVTDLDTYINRPESVYNYEVVSTDNVIGATVYTLNMTSLTWFDDQLTTTPVWWHWQVIVVPDTLNFRDAGFLLIGSGTNNDGPPSLITGDVAQLIELAIDTGAVASVVNMIPNQPLVFVNDEFGEPRRSEDEIIGYSWRLFIKEDYTQPEIIANLPMTKAAKLAVDTMIDHAASVDPTIQITEVMASGYSKRGWTTWMLAHTDPRVFAIAPIVFDLLDFYNNLVRHYMSMGGWSYAFSPYHNCLITQELHNPRTQVIGSHVDAMFYTERMTMPKLLMGATGDQFFLPDDTHLWWDNMPGENHYQLFENDDHVLGRHTERLWANLKSFFVAVKTGEPRPQYSYTMTEDADTGTIELTTTTTPNWVRVWVANNTERVCPNDDTTATCRRDFRLTRSDFPADTLIQWESTMLSDQGGGVYSYTLPIRRDYGKTIFHFEMSYDAPGNRDIQLTTEAHVIEDTLPFTNCTTPLECYGQLV